MYYLIPLGGIILYGIYANYDDLCYAYVTRVKPLINKYINGIEEDEYISFSDNNEIKVSGVSVHNQYSCENKDTYEIEHFESFLNYIYGFTIEIPKTVSRIKWNEYDVVIVEYKYNGKDYAIQLNDDIIFEKVNNISPLTRRIIYAEHIVTEDDKKEVTDDLKRFAGIREDFYKDFINNLNEFKYILKDYNKGILVIVDTFGQTTEIDLVKTNKLDWNCSFSL